MTNQFDTPGIIYLAEASGDLWGVSEVGKTTAKLFCVKASQETRRVHREFLVANRMYIDMYKDHLVASDFLTDPDRRTMEVDVRWFDRADVKPIACDHTHGGCRREGDGLYCDHCGIDVVLGEGDDCPACGGDLGDEDGHCGCPAALKVEAEFVAQFDYMRPMVKRAMAARRAGDEEEYERIRQEALR